MILAVGAALATPASLDVELYRPSVGPDVVYGVRSPGYDEPRLSAGLLAHYSHDPLVLAREIGVVSAVVRHRVTLDLLAAWQPHRLFGFELGAPFVTDWGSETPEDAADRFGTGDMRVAARVGPLRRGALRAGARLELAVPLGIREAWMGEEQVRVSPGLAAELRRGPFTVAADLGATLRPAPIETTGGLVVGHELLGSVGAGVELWPERARASLALQSRHGLNLAAGGHPAELIAAVEVRPVRALRTWVMVGRGMTAGYGAPDLRVGVGLLYTPADAAPLEAAPELHVADADFSDRPERDEDGDTLPGEEAAPPAEADAGGAAAPRARVVSDEIVILHPIQFELGTSRILPESMPTVAAVAGVLNGHAEILHLVIEGHASEEGDYAYNYELSMARASAVYRELVSAGVHPDRLSCRSVGEVGQTGSPADADAQAQKRRVVFRISQWLPPGATPPTYSPSIVVPWSGQELPMVTPPPPPPPPPPPAPELDLEEDE